MHAERTEESKNKSAAGCAVQRSLSQPNQELNQRARGIRTCGSVIGWKGNTSRDYRGWQRKKAESKKSGSQGSAERATQYNMYMHFTRIYIEISLITSYIIMS